MESGLAPACRPNTSHGGAIAHLLLMVPAYEARAFSAIYAGLIDSLPADCQLDLIAEPDAVPHIRRWPRQDALTINETGDLQITPWARDPILAGENAGGESLLTITSDMDRADDLAAIRQWAERWDGQILPSDGCFEGGNILFGRNEIFVGADTILPDAVAAETAEEIITIASPHPVPAETSRPASAGKQEWQEIFHYRNKTGTRQPVFHIDMFLSLAGPDAEGRERILVGDPQLAAELLEQPLHPLALAAHFDGIADNLAGRGFVVTRNPMPMIYMDDSTARRRTWFYASSNNVLVQRSAAAGHIVWMPEFGHDNWPELARTDAENRHIWEEMGYTVRMIPDGQKLAENLGGLHCLTNVLKRG